MKLMNHIIIAIAALICLSSLSFSQTKEHEPAISRQDDESLYYHNAWGGDILISNNGFGLGAFYRHEYTDDIAGYMDFSISESKDNREIDTYDYYTGETYVQGKINRFLVLPLYAGIQYRLFSDEIMDNFRPYVNAAVGPTMIYVFPYNQDYFSALWKGQPHYTVGGYIGLGAYFGSMRSSLFGLNIRYYLVRDGSGLPSMQYGTDVSNKSDFGGFVISFNIGKAF